MGKYYTKKTIYPDNDAKLFWHFYMRKALLCGGLRDRVMDFKDGTILVTGPTGVGKSTLVGKLCFNFFSSSPNPKDEESMMFTDSDYIIDPEEYASKMVTSKGKVLWWDESREGIARRNWQKKINNSIIGRKNKNRKNGIISFIVLPYEREIDQSFSKHITMWIWVSERGKAQIFVSGKTKKGGESLNIQTIIDREEKWAKENPNRKVCPLTIHPEYIGNVTFGKFTNAEQKRYDRLVDENSAVGELSEEEEAKLNGGVIINNKEDYVPLELDEIQNGKYKTKADLFYRLKELTGFADAKLVNTLNRHLKVRGLDTFMKLKL